MLKKISLAFFGLLLFGAGCQQISVGDEWDTRTAPDGTQWEVHDESNTLKSVVDEEKTTVDGEHVFGAGFAPVTGFQTQTTARVSASATTIPVASVTDKAGNTINPSLISSSSTVRMYFNFEAGTSREEPFYCTGISGLNLTNCVRGLSFQGSDLTGSSTIAQVHNAGASVIMTNLGVMYGNEFVGTSGDQTIFDTKTFNTLPRATSTTAVPTNNAEFVTKYYSDTQVAAGFSCSSVDQTRGIECSGAPATFGINISATSSGLLFSGGQLKVSTSSTGGIAVNGIGNLYLDTSDALSWSGNQTFNASVFVNTPTIDGEATPKSYVDSSAKEYYFGDGSDGNVTSSAGYTTLTRDMFYENLTIPAGATMTAAGFHIYVRDTLNVIGGLTATGSNGGDAAGATAGFGATTTYSEKTLSIGSSGGLGAACSTAGQTNSGSAGSATSSALGGVGGTGGAGGAGGGGGGGTLTAPSSFPIAPGFSDMMLDTTGGLVKFKGGTGGGGGGCTTGGGEQAGGGGGGSAGGVLWISAFNIVGSGNIWAVGGIGGAGAGTGGTSRGGGGAGGGGGLLYTRFKNYTFTGNATTSGGVGGAGAGSGTNGATGSPGTFYQIDL